MHQEYHADSGNKDITHIFLQLNRVEAHIYIDKCVKFFYLRFIVINITILEI